MLVTVPVAVPDSGISCGLPNAPSTIVSAPLIAPVTVGVKVTLMVQVLLAAMVPVQVFAETAKSPLVVTVPMVRATVEFVSVIFWAVAVFLYRRYWGT